MSRTQTRTTTTAHGDVEYETVTCDSCGSEVAASEAREFVMGDVQESAHLQVSGRDKYMFDSSTVRHGYACPYCVDEGPIEFPGWLDARLDRLRSLTLVDVVGALVLLLIGFTTVTVVLGGVL